VLRAIPEAVRRRLDAWLTGLAELERRAGELAEVLGAETNESLHRIIKMA
jgi:hypothetical protein